MLSAHMAHGNKPESRGSCCSSQRLPLFSYPTGCMVRNGDMHIKIHKITNPVAIHLFGAREIARVSSMGAFMKHGKHITISY